MRSQTEQEALVDSSEAVRVSDRVYSGNTGAAAAIRKLAVQFPELSQGEIAREVGCHPTNVHKVLKHFRGVKDQAFELKDFQESKAEIYDQLQARILGSISDADLLKAPLQARVTSAAILEDKARVIRGQATQINVSVLLDAVQAIKQMRKSE
jgi:hypothetical protein